MNRHPIRERALHHWADNPDLNAAEVAACMAELGHPVQPATLRQWKRRYGLGGAATPESVTAGVTPPPRKAAPPARPPSPELAAAVWVNVHSILPWPDNPRKNEHAVPAVAASIMKFGYGRTFVGWRPEDARMLVVGHTARLAVLHNLEHHPHRIPPDAPGPELIPMRWRSDWSEEEARAYAIADNKLGELSGWVEDDLARQLAELQEEGIDPLVLGFAEKEVERLLKQLGSGTGTGAGDPGPSLVDPDSPATWELRHGDCVELLRAMSDKSIDAIVTDPPYGIGFMGKDWDCSVPGLEWAEQCLRVLKPGGHIIAFAANRTIHRLAVALEDAGFEIRDQIGWVTWQGFPKSLDISKAIDKTAAPATDDVKRWAGWGTALKPAIEPCMLARKPLEGTVAENVLKWHVGGLNIDGCRFAYGDEAWPGPQEAEPGTHCSYFPGPCLGHKSAGGAYDSVHMDNGPVSGRWPANLYHCPKPATAEKDAGTSALRTIKREEITGRKPDSPGQKHGRSGKTATDVRNYHPTVKPVGLMRWLCRLITPSRGLVLDTFCGSGTTGIAALNEGFNFLGMEREEKYLPIIRARLGEAMDGEE